MSRQKRLLNHNDNSILNAMGAKRQKMILAFKMSIIWVLFQVSHCYTFILVVPLFKYAHIVKWSLLFHTAKITCWVFRELMPNTPPPNQSIKLFSRVSTFWHCHTMRSSTQELHKSYQKHFAPKRTHNFTVNLQIYDRLHTHSYPGQRAGHTR